MEGNCRGQIFYRGDEQVEFSYDGDGWCVLSVLDEDGHDAEYSVPQGFAEVLEAFLYGVWDDAMAVYGE